MEDVYMQKMSMSSGKYWLVIYREFSGLGETRETKIFSLRMSLIMLAFQKFPTF